MRLIQFIIFLYAALRVSGVDTHHQDSETCRAACRNIINWISRILLDSY